MIIFYSYYDISSKSGSEDKFVLSTQKLQEAPQKFQRQQLSIQWILFIFSQIVVS